MKNKKMLFLALAIIVIIAIASGIFIATLNSNYLYTKDGTIADGHKDLIKHLQGIDNTEERKKQIDYSLEENLITKQEANELY